MLHALSLAELEDDDDKDEERWAYRLRAFVVWRFASWSGTVS